MATEQLQQMGQQKRSAAEAVESLLEQVRAIVFDVEGTTTPITFLKDILIPENIEDHLKDTFEEPETIKDLATLREMAQKEKDDGEEGAETIPDAAEGQEAVKKAVAACVQRWVDCKADCAEFRQFRNHVLRHGFECDRFKADVFDDVPPMLRMLSEEGFNLYVYSSGTGEIEKMLFANTPEGDITDVFANFFDEAAMGSKTEKDSYLKIASEIKIDPKNILYLTDTPEEADAAFKAGWRSALVIRPGNADLTDEHLQNYACIEQLDELYGDEDEEEIKRLHGDDNGEADDDDEEDENDDEVDEDEDGEEDDGEGEGEDA
ncbi:enolase-phosphatase E1-like [Babylonia areolata]|uniref:enolase-phosphatase E1-like n=1 Tax=Babylonia areolata TaxID=304850 RepID=UPI003FD5372F